MQFVAEVRTLRWLFGSQSRGARPHSATCECDSSCVAFDSIRPLIYYSLSHTERALHCCGGHAGIRTRQCKLCAQMHLNAYCLESYDLPLYRSLIWAHIVALVPPLPAHRSPTPFPTATSIWTHLSARVCWMLSDCWTSVSAFGIGHRANACRAVSVCMPISCCCWSCENICPSWRFAMRAVLYSR